MAGAAAYIAHQPADACGKTIKQLAIQWLVFEFVGNAGGILTGNGIVTGLRINRLTSYRSITNTASRANKVANVLGR